MHLGNKLLSGIEINQNVATNSTALGSTAVNQEFRLPVTYRRGVKPDEYSVPSVAGFSILTSITAGTEDIVVIDYVFQRYMIGVGWIDLTAGSNVGAPASGSRVWLDTYFDEPIELDFDALEDNFRIVITGRTNGGRQHQVIPYANGQITLDNSAINVPDIKAAPYLFTHDGYPAIVRYNADAGVAEFSQQQGPTLFYYGSVDNERYGGAYTSSGNIGTNSGTVHSPLAFRLLAATADAGRDFFGNTFRHDLRVHSVANVTTVDGGREDQYWLSKPNPSAFAVEAQYFDISQDGSPSVVDALLLDPVTAGVYFTVYYSSDGEPADDADGWDAKLWTRVPKTFQAKRRDTYVMPEPFVARYAKVEYTHLQARPYRPGPFQQPIKYRKHPKWVLDYFLLRLENTLLDQNSFTPGSVSVQYDALDLAYNYYLDDLTQEPDLPAHYSADDATRLKSFFQSRTDLSDQLDSATLDKINYALNPYKSGVFGSSDTLLADLVYGGPSVMATETGTDLFRDLSPDVSSLNRDAVILEQQYPVMFYYLTCRHYYRFVQATPTHDRAYFAGIREIAWMREQYNKATDTNLYIEIGGDGVNLQRSDFVHDESALVIGNG